jgi:hypothetical protein
LVEGLGCAVYAALDVYDVTDYVYDGCEAEKHRILSRDLKQKIEFLLSAGKSGSFSIVVCLSCSSLNPP